MSKKLNITWGFYRSSQGGCTKGVNPLHSCAPLSASGAYLFRPNSQLHPPLHKSKDDGSELYYPGPLQKPTLEVVESPLATKSARFSATG